mmetsp:Transcript_11385/g.30691  ORF Transcript_11385/g.30691 Transcript_11385/m.30691 type:complete len:600 (-) Transcript_11385:348-2147(-)
MADDDGTLLPGWTAVDSGEGDYYYWNEDTDEVKWEKPVKPKPKPPGPPPRMNKPPPAPPKPSAPPKPTTPRPARTPTFAPASSSSMAAPPPASASTSRPADALAYQRQLAAEKEAQRHAAVAVREAEVQAMATQQAQRAQGASALNSYTYHAPAEFTEGIAEVRLDSGVPGQKTAESAAKLNRSKTKKRNMSMLTAGMQTLGLSAAARKFPKCDYPEGSDTRRLVALQIVCGGAFTFSGKRLIKEGPLCKRNRDGLRTYQFILLSTELLYCEASSQAEKYEVHHVYPLAQLRISNETQGKVGHEEDAFTILTPVKSFVVEAVDGAEKAEWYSTLEDQIAFACQLASVPVEGHGLKFAAVWHLDSEATECACCMNGFTMMNRRHHCRACGAVICGSCSNNKLRLDHIDSEKFVRVCENCYADNKANNAYGIRFYSARYKADEIVATNGPSPSPTTAPVPWALGAGGGGANGGSGGAVRRGSGVAMLNAAYNLAAQPPAQSISDGPKPALPSKPKPKGPPPSPRSTVTGFLGRMRGGSTTTYPLAVLQGPSADLPADVDPAHKERYLSDAEFQETFGMKKAAFKQVAGWMKESMKEGAGLN